MLQYCVHEKPLHFCYFQVLCDLIFAILAACFVISSVDISKVGMLLVFLGLPSTGLLLQYMFHALVHFMSWYRSKCTWLGSRVVGVKYWQILILKKLPLKKLESFYYFCSCYMQGRKHPLLLGQLANVHWFDISFH